MLTVYFGKRGSGKTTSIRAIIPTLKKPVFIIDLLGNYTGYESGGHEWEDVETVRGAISAAIRYLENPKEHSGIIVLQSGNLSFSIDFICAALWKIGGEKESDGGTIVLDEGDAFSANAESPCYDEMIRYGRNKHIDVVVGCRRPAEIPKNITAAADIVYVFMTQEVRDLEYYADYLGDELTSRLSRLQPHYGIYKDFQNQREGDFWADPSGRIQLLKEKAQGDSLSPAPRGTGRAQRDLALPDPDLPSDPPIAELQPSAPIET